MTKKLQRKTPILILPQILPNPPPPKNAKILMFWAGFVKVKFQVLVLGWEFQFLILISGTPIGSGIPIPFPIPDIPVIFLISDFWKVRTSEFRFAKFEIQVTCWHRNS
jgi:hypothetical protein